MTPDEQVGGSPLADALDDAEAAAAATGQLQPVHPALRDAGIYLLNQVLMRPVENWSPFELAINPTDPTAVADVPTCGGVYIFVTPGQFFAYPGGGSSILYIGKASPGRGLGQRLQEHCRCIREIQAGQNEGRFYPLYEWAATYRPLVTYSGTEHSDPTKMEYELLRVFADAYRAAPVANSRSAW